MQRRKSALKTKKAVKRFVGLFEESEKCQQSHAVGAITLTRMTLFNLKSRNNLGESFARQKVFDIEREKLGEGTIIVQVELVDNFPVGKKCIQFNIYMEATCELHCFIIMIIKT